MRYCHPVRMYARTQERLVASMFKCMRLRLVETPFVAMDQRDFDAARGSINTLPLMRLIKVSIVGNGILGASPATLALVRR